MEQNKKVKIAELCKKVKSGASTFYLKDGTVSLKLIRHANVSDSGIIDVASVESELARESPRTNSNLLKANDILIAVRGPTKIALVPPEAEGYYFSAEFIALEIDESSISPKIVAAFLKMPNVTAYLNHKCDGRLLRSVNQDDLLAIEIDIPTPEKQKYLMELLDLVADQKLILVNENEKLDELKYAALGQFLGGGQA